MAQLKQIERKVSLVVFQLLEKYRLQWIIWHILGLVKVTYSYQGYYNESTENTTYAYVHSFSLNFQHTASQQNRTLLWQV